MNPTIDLEQIVAGCPDGVVILGADGTIQFVNPPAETLLGRRTAELSGQRLDWPTVPDDTFTKTFARPDGVEVVAEVRVTAAPWLGESATVLWLRDITQYSSTGWDAVLRDVVALLAGLFENGTEARGAVRPRRFPGRQDRATRRAHGRARPRLARPVGHTHRPTG